eukprot:20193_1
MSQLTDLFNPTSNKSQSQRPVYYENQPIELRKELQSLISQIDEENYRIDALQQQLTDTKMRNCIEFLRGIYANGSANITEWTAITKYRKREHINDITFQKCLILLDLQCIEYLIYGYTRRVEKILRCNISCDIKTFCIQYFSISLWRHNDFDGVGICNLFTLECLRNGINNKECMVCKTNRKNCCIIPCMHIVICFECGSLMKDRPRSDCPLCDKPICDVKRIYGTHEYDDD